MGDIFYNRVARLYGPGKLHIETEPLKTSIKEGEVLLQPIATGICGSDIHLYKGLMGCPNEMCYPVIPGHEFIGVVVECKGLVKGGDGKELHRGMRVAVDPAEPCGQCAPCKAGLENLCEKIKFCGSEGVNGSLQNWMIVKGKNCWPVPDILTDEEALLLEPLGVAYHAVALARLKIGENAAVIGAGTIGLLVIELLQLVGVEKIFVIEPLDWRKDFAVQLGAIPVDGSLDQLVTFIRHNTDGKGVDVVFEAAWAGEALTVAASIVKAGGKIVMIGIPPDDRLLLSHSLVRRKGLTLILSRRMNRAYPLIIPLVATKQIKLKGFVTHRFSFEEASQAFEWASSYPTGTIKVIIQHQ